jgi:hypothetical protein
MGMSAQNSRKPTLGRLYRLANTYRKIIRIQISDDGSSRDYVFHLAKDKQFAAQLSLTK